MVQALEKQQVGIDARIVERGCADLADAQVDLAADRHQAGKTNATGTATRDQRADHAAAVRGDEDPTDRRLRLGKCGVRSQ